jgi:hypothetical protein
VRRRTVTNQTIFLFMAFPLNAMGMPQKEAHENHILEMMEGKGTSHSCYRGVANLIHFTAGGL